MFVRAIELVSGFTRPVFSISRYYGQDSVLPGAATIFFVNEDGWAVTSKQTAKVIVSAGGIDRKYAEFREEKQKITGEEELHLLEERYQYKSGVLCQRKVSFVDSVDRMERIECRMHPHYNLALLHFCGYHERVYTGHATFAASSDTVKPGRSLCRLGYPFPEFRNFSYDRERDDIVWTKGKTTSPCFPADGMVTRLLASEKREIVGIELSTPGLAGIAGGPLFDPRGIVYGMQSTVSSMNFGHCIHMDVIKSFLFQEGVLYYEDQLGAQLRQSDQSLLRQGIIPEGGHGKMS